MVPFAQRPHRVTDSIEVRQSWECHLPFIGLFMSNNDRALDDLEVSRVAERLVKSRGISATDYATMKIKVMEETGDKENQTYWEKILEKVEKLLYEA